VDCGLLGCNVTLCSFIDGYQLSEVMYCLHWQGILKYKCGQNPHYSTCHSSENFTSYRVCSPQAHSKLSDCVGGFMCSFQQTDFRTNQVHCSPTILYLNNPDWTYPDTCVTRLSGVCCVKF
jgi:hypothetical protein